MAIVWLLRTLFHNENSVSVFVHLCLHVHMVFIHVVLSLFTSGLILERFWKASSSQVFLFNPQYKYFLLSPLEILLVEVEFSFQYIPNYVSFRPRLEKCGRPVLWQILFILLCFRLEMIEEKRFSMKPMPQNVLVYSYRGTIKWRSTGLGYFILEFTNLQFIKAKVSTLSCTRSIEQNFILMNRLYNISASAMENSLLMQLFFFQWNSQPTAEWLHC